MKLRSLWFDKDGGLQVNNWGVQTRVLPDGHTVTGSTLGDSHQPGGELWIGYKNVPREWFKPCPHRGKAGSHQDPPPLWWCFDKVGRQDVVRCWECRQVAFYGYPWKGDETWTHPDRGVVLVDPYQLVPNGYLVSRQPWRVDIASNEEPDMWLLKVRCACGFRGAGWIETEGPVEVLHSGSVLKSPRGAIGSEGTYLLLARPGAKLYYHARGRLYGARGAGIAEITDTEIKAVAVDYERPTADEIVD